MAKLTTTAKGIGVQIKPLGSDDWTEIGTLSPGSTFEISTGITSSKIFNGNITTAYRRDMYPGSLALDDQGENGVTITPTGNGGYTIHTTSAVRINRRMHSAIVDHMNRCLDYTKPAAELET